MQCLPEQSISLMGVFRSRCGIVSRRKDLKMKEAVNWSIRTAKMTKADLADPDQTVTIETPCGPVKGLQYDGYRLYRGIPYATCERWEPAEPVTAWQGVYDATHWGPRAMQFKGYYGRPSTAVNAFYSAEALFEVNNQYAEDALNLNIWTPTEAKNCPVLFYIHGGAFLNGSGSDPWIDGEAYTKHGVILVSINYRLGPWHQVYGDGHRGNLCLTDQITAIEWVKNNIKAYGGDPDRITIAGESAGAMSVQCILFSPLLKEGMIAGGIIMSDGGSFFHQGTSASVEAAWDKVKQAKGVKTLQELKSLPPVEIYRAWAPAVGTDTNCIYPVINGESRIYSVQDALAINQIANVPVMFGFLSEDMYPRSMYQQAVDYGMARAAVGGKPVYVYDFNRQQIEEDGSFSRFGAFHAADLFYLFGTLYRNRRPYGEIDFRISTAMVDYISNFCKNGDPNGDGLAQWRPITEDYAGCMNFGDEPCGMILPDLDKLEAQEKKGILFPQLDDWNPPPVE